jgi:hypothetical protein
VPVVRTWGRRLSRGIREAVRGEGVLELDAIALKKGDIVKIRRFSIAQERRMEVMQVHG